MRYGRALLAVVAGLVLTSGAAFGWVEYEKARHSGGLTDTVDRHAFQPETGPFLIENVSLLSEDGETMLPERFVLVADGKIGAISQSREGLALPPSFQSIDGTGKYLIPGLIDSHVHLHRRSNDLLVFLAHGVTYVREMGGDARSLEMRRETLAGAAGPHMYVSSYKIYGDKGAAGIFTEWTRNRINVSDPADAEPVVQRLEDEGYDAVKISGFTTPEVHRALLAAASKHGLDTIGHFNRWDNFEDLLASSQRELSHVEEITKALIREYGGYKGEDSEAFLAFVRSRADDVARQFRDGGMAVGTTLALMESLVPQKFALPQTLANTKLDYVDPGQLEGTMLIAGWLPGNNSYALDPKDASDPGRRAAARKWWSAYAEAVRIMTTALARNGATLLAGTDAGTPILVPGQSLHQELKALVASELSPAQALRSATADAGKWLGEPVGRIAPGYRADLVLLDANPLADIANTARISDVFLSGELYQRSQLDDMLAQVAAANNSSRSIDLTELHQQLLKQAEMN